MSQATDILKTEHRLIEQVLGSLAAFAGDIAPGASPPDASHPDASHPDASPSDASPSDASPSAASPPDISPPDISPPDDDAAGYPRRRVADYARFFREFADRCHHGKEEARLFAALETAGFPTDAGPVAVMLHEHDQGRRLVGRLHEIGAGDGPLGDAEREEIAAVAAEFGRLLGQHIQKEDRILFPMADRALTPAAQARLAEDFAAFERQAMGDGAHAALHALAESLIAAHPPRAGFAPAEQWTHACGALDARGDNT